LKKRCLFYIRREFLSVKKKPLPDYLIRNLNKLTKEYNEYVRFNDQDLDEDDENEDYEISPTILGVVFTMVQFYGGKPAKTSRQYINQTKKLNIPVFNNKIRENKKEFSVAPETGIPIVLNNYSSEPYKTIVEEIEQFTTEFQKKVGL
jgi:chromosome partitioning protein